MSIIKLFEKQKGRSVDTSSQEETQMKTNRRTENLQDSSSFRAYGSNKDVSKVERYKWRDTGQMGSMIMIDKNDLFVDLSYQREATSQGAILRIARNFQWALFGCLIVAETENGLYVLDGAHRLRGTLLRDDINKVPCIIFEMNSMSEEARIFYDYNTSRRAVSPYDRHRAGLVANFEIAEKAEKLITKYGYTFTPSEAREFQTSAIMSIYRCIVVNQSLADSMINILVKVAQGLPIKNEEIKGLFYLMQMNPAIDFFSFPLKNMIDEGMENIRSSINRYKLLCNKGGPKVYAGGMLEIVNKGQSKNKVILPS